MILFQGVRTETWETLLAHQMVDAVLDLGCADDDRETLVETHRKAFAYLPRPLFIDLAVSWMGNDYFTFDDAGVYLLINEGIEALRERHRLSDSDLAALIEACPYPLEGDGPLFIEGEDEARDRLTHKYHDEVLMPLLYDAFGEAFVTD